MARSHKSNYFPCRCAIKNKCSYRVTLTFDPALAQVPPKCPQCGSGLIVDTYRKDRRDGETCYCAAAPGRDGQNRPHRKGSMAGCEHEKLPF